MRFGFPILQDDSPAWRDITLIHNYVDGDEKDVKYISFI